MSPGKRLEVRETDHFAYLVYDYFRRDERGPLGELTRQDFIELELKPAKEIIATRFYELDELFPGRSDYRIYTVAAIYVPLYIIEAQLTPDSKLIELTDLQVDLNPPEPFSTTTDR